ncbi:carbamoyl phosphate synthetase subunit beta [Gammaproteobacteria bacterium]
MNVSSNKKVIKPNRVILLGSGALRIGQAGEFDYSGSQALKALREESIETVLINSNIATIQTDSGLADKTYFLPVEPYFVEKVIAKEKVDAVLLSFGGQTALNCGLYLEESGVFAEYGVRVLGTPVETIRMTEDRHLFAGKLSEIGVKTARSKAVYSVKEAIEAAHFIGFPTMMRSGFSLGGKGSAIVYNERECQQLAEMVFSSVSQILVEECLKGWKEIEYEVVRDNHDNCITVCNMENFDPMGIHTGESIVVAPSQTLDDYEHQMLRDIAIKTIRHLGVVGECNIQYALDPQSREYRVIEVNARLSRSSALASKATGYPLAYVATKIALGYDLTEIPNGITKVTTAFFEPAMDYIVCKIPRWDLDKFDGAGQNIGSEMKSVGEVMSIGRSFAEAVQKALRMLEIGVDGLDPDAFNFNDLYTALTIPTPRRIFAVAYALRNLMTVDEVHELTRIDRFFLYEIVRIVTLEQATRTHRLCNLDDLHMRQLKKAGFSDHALGRLSGESEDSVREHRHRIGVRPYLSQIDTLAAEYPAETNFLYFTYGAQRSDVSPSERPKILVLGSGCYRIGSSVEFDWCTVSAVKAAQELGYEVIMLNSNPETVSTDFDICEQLVFDEITLETVIELNDFYRPIGLLVSAGGQTPNNLALKLHKVGIHIFGTAPESIDNAEDRNKFSLLLDRLGVEQPLWVEADSSGDLEKKVRQMGGFPVLVRPSYVLSGAAMHVAYSMEELRSFLGKAVEISTEHPVIISKFEEASREVEFDAVACNGEIHLYSLAEHIENAGVHSGDATLVLPPQRLTIEAMKKIRLIGGRLAKALKITGPFNGQMLCRKNQVKVIECNLRASRTFPYISKALGVNFIREATALMLRGVGLSEKQPRSLLEMSYVVVKSPQFSFARIKGADPRLGVEMSSTGEVACFGADVEEALLAAQLATGFKIPKKGVLVSVEQESERARIVNEIELLRRKGLVVYATPETAIVLREHRVECITVAVDELLRRDGQPLVEFLRSGHVDLIIGTGLF